MFIILAWIVAVYLFFKFILPITFIIFVVLVLVLLFASKTRS